MDFLPALAIYLFPTAIAAFRHHQNMMPIALVNVFTGLTIVGWFFSLIWAFTSNTKPVRV